MTTEPKFVPNEAVTITMEDNISFNVRLVDCVGYMVKSAIGHMEDEVPRMVKLHGPIMRFLLKKPLLLVPERLSKSTLP